ncbi:hypothetical protein ACFSR6_17570, partial [Pedobacter vanadiisoli]
TQTPFLPKRVAKVEKIITPAKTLNQNIEQNSVNLWFTAGNNITPCKTIGTPRCFSKLFSCSNLSGFLRQAHPCTGKRLKWKTQSLARNCNEKRETTYIVALKPL